MSHGQTNQMSPRCSGWSLLGHFKDAAWKSVTRCGYSRRRVSTTSDNHWKSCLAALANNRGNLQGGDGGAVMVARESSFLTVCHEVFLFRTGQTMSCERCELRHSTCATTNTTTSTVLRRDIRHAWSHSFTGIISINPHTSLTN